MEPSLKQRLVGAAVLIALAVIFIPMLLDGSGKSTRVSMDMTLPPEPKYEIPPRLPPLPKEIPDKQAPSGTASSSPQSAPTPEKPASAPSAKAIKPAEPAPAKPATQPEPTPKPASKTATMEKGMAWDVQVGSFGEQDNAVVLQDKLRAAGYPAFVQAGESGGSKVYRVRVGPYVKRELAEQALKKLTQSQKLKGIVVSHP